MGKEKSMGCKFETVVWSLLLIWWGLRWWPLETLPNGSGLIGTGLILLGLNMIRSMRGIPTKGSTNTLGILALVCGGLLVTNESLQIPVQLPMFEIMLIVLGVFLLARGLLGFHRTGIKDPY